MCGAFTLHHSKLDVAGRFMVPEQGLPLDPSEPRFKVSPSESIAIVCLDKDDRRRLEEVKWGLVPFWAKDPSIGRKMINARAEAIEAKPAFRNALAKRRCLIPADGFYEWDAQTKQPMYFRRADGQLFAFAGLWEDWHDDRIGPDRMSLRSCTLITTQANRTVGRVHDRMPVMLEPSAEYAWLATSHATPALGELAGLLRPFPDDLMEGYWVSKSVNKRGPHGPEAIAPV